MKPLIFLGSSLPITMFVEAAEHMGYTVHGIIDKDYYGNTEQLWDIPVIDSEDSFDDAEMLAYYRENFVFFCVVNPLPMKDPVSTRNREKRHRFIDLIREHRLETVTLISKTVSISPNSTLGTNVFVGNFITIEPHVTVGDFTNLWGLTVIGHHTQIGENTCIQRHSDVFGGCKIGNNVHLSGQAGLIHDITIGDGAWIHPGIRVARDIEPGEIVGNTRESRRKTSPFDEYIK